MSVLESRSQLTVILIDKTLPFTVRRVNLRPDCNSAVRIGNRQRSIEEQQRNRTESAFDQWENSVESAVTTKNASSKRRNADRKARKKKGIEDSIKAWLQGARLSHEKSNPGDRVQQRHLGHRWPKHFGDRAPENNNEKEHKHRVGREIATEFALDLYVHFPERVPLELTVVGTAVAVLGNLKKMTLRSLFLRPAAPKR